MADLTVDEVLAYLRRQRDAAEKADDEPALNRYQHLISRVLAAKALAERED